MNKKNIIIVASIFIAIAISVFWWRAASDGAIKGIGVIDEITLATQPSEALALIWVAEHEGFFAGNDLKVNIAPPANAQEIVNALETGTADVGTIGEYSFVRSNFEKSGLLVFAAIDTAQTIQLITRKGFGVSEIGDLKGKTIGVTPSKEPDFFLESFLSKNNLTEADITIAPLEPTETVRAITEKKVDVVVTFGQGDDQIKKDLKDEVIIWSGQSEQPYYVVLVSNGDYIASHKTAIEKLLRALLQAEAFIQADPARSQLIVAKRLGYDVSLVNQIWLGHNFELTLPANMLALMDDQYRWAVQKGMTDITEIPKYSNFIYLDALEKVKPNAVTIVRQTDHYDQE